MAVACTATALTLPLLRPPANRAMPPSACSEASTPVATPRPAARPGDDTDEACDVRPPVTPAGSDDHSQGPVAKTGPDSVISLLGGILGMPLLPRELGVVIFTALLMLMYVGTEASCGGFLTSFAVLSEGLSESTGQYLTGEPAPPTCAAVVRRCCSTGRRSQPRSGAALQPGGCSRSH